MRVPNLRTQVVVQSPPNPAVVDTHGEPSGSWATYITTYAEIEPLLGKELIAAQQVKAEVTHRVTIRYRMDYPVNSTHRVKYGSRYFAISYVINPLERKEWLQLYCIEGTRDG